MSAAPGAPPSAVYAYQIAKGLGFLAMPAIGVSAAPSVQPVANYGIVPNTSMAGM